MSHSNPYSPDSNPYTPDPILANDDLMIRRVAIRPIELLSRSYALIRDQYWLFLAIVLTGVFLGAIAPMGILFGPLMVGIYLCYIQRELGQPVEFGTLFRGFEFFLNSLVAMLIIAGLSLVVMFPLFIFFGLGIVMSILSVPTIGDDPAIALAVVTVFTFVFLVIIASALITLPFVFAFQLIADRGLSGGQAVWIGFQGVMSNFWGIGWFMFVIMIISMICASLCYLPMLLFMPISMGAQFLLYREVFGPNLMLAQAEEK